MRKNAEKKVVDFEEQAMDQQIDELFEDDFDDDFEDIDVPAKEHKMRDFLRKHKKGVVITTVVGVLTFLVAMTLPGLLQGDDSVMIDVDEASGEVKISDVTESTEEVVVEN